MNFTILVVDDSSSIREVVGFALKKAEFNVLEAENGKQCLVQMQG